MKSTMFLSFYCFLLLFGSGFGFECIRKALTPNRYLEGSIHSPGYPNHQSFNICYMWYHVVFRDTKVEIMVQDLDIPVTDNCKSNDSNRLVFGSRDGPQYCGFGIKNTKYETVVSGFFYILFIVHDHWTGGRGFVLHYKLSKPDNPTTTQTTTSVSHHRLFDPTTEIDHMSPSHCSFTMKDISGTITVPSNVASCGKDEGTFTWLLQSPKPSSSRYDAPRPTFMLKVQYFHFSPDCCVLDVYQGSDENAQLISHFSSADHPNSIRVNGPQVFLKFTYRRRGVNNFTIQFEMSETCQFGYTLCSFNESGCYPKHKRCDGEWDCPLKGGDESGCTTTCPKDKFACSETSVYCFHEEDRCDGKGACANYRDEQNCTPKQCSEEKGLFLCKNKRCIYEKWRCDHTTDCEDGSDEDDCNRLATSPRFIMACVVGTTISSLLLVLTLSFACRVYTLRMRQHRGEPEVRQESPLSRIEQDLLRQRVPPPQYNEAMLTSRSYDEAYLELLNQGHVDFTPDSGRTQEGNHNSSAASGSGRRRSRRGNRWRRRHLHRNLRFQQLLLNPPPHYLPEQPPSYSEEPENQSVDMELHANDSSHELQTLPIMPSSLEPVPPPYSLHSEDPPSSSESDDDDDDNDDDDDYVDFPERNGENCQLLEGSEEEEENDTCLSIGIGSELDHPHLSSLTAPPPTSLSPSLTSSDLGQVSEVLNKEEADDDDIDDSDNDKKEVEVGKDGGECSPSPSSLSQQTEEESVTQTSIKVESTSIPSGERQENVGRDIDEDDDDCECILSIDTEEEEVYDSSDVACLIAS